jgi:hypothetical protein
MINYILLLKKHLITAPQLVCPVFSPQTFEFKIWLLSIIGCLKLNAKENLIAMGLSVICSDRVSYASV